MKMKLNVMTSLAAAVAIAAGLTACGGGGANQKPSTMAKIACDESFETIFEQEVNVYEYIYPKEDVMVYYVPEQEAVDSILAMDGVKGAVLTRQLTEQEVGYLRSHKKVVHQQKIAVDALALIVNPANPVEILSKKDIAEILSGDVTRWDQVEPSKLGEIQVVFDHAQSSTVAYMRDSLLGGKPFGPNVAAVKSNPEVFKAVASNKNAVGVIGVSWVASDMSGRQMSVEEMAQAVEKSDTTQLDFSSDVKVLKIRGNDEVTAYRPYQAYIFDGSYPLYRSVYMVSTAPGGTVAHRFYSFVTGFQGQKIIQMSGILPATVRPRMAVVE